MRILKKFIAVLILMVISISGMVSTNDNFIFQGVDAAMAVKAQAAEEKTYATSFEGTNIIEIGTIDDNTISLESEKINYDFSGVTLPIEDEVSCIVKRTYVLTNTSSKEVYVPIAVPMILTVSEVTVDENDKTDFESGCSIQVDGIDTSGMIYSSASTKKLRTSSVYDDFVDILKHIDYAGYFSEAFSMYGITSDTMSTTSGISAIGQIPDSTTKTYYQVSDDGDRMLCMVVYNLTFAPNETHIIHMEELQTGTMSRPTKYSELGTTYTYELIGGNLDTFHSVGDIKITFTTAADDILPLLDTSSSRYLNDDTWTVHYIGSGRDFSFSVGTEITEDEINDINAGHGIGKSFYSIIFIVTPVIILASIAYVIYTYRKRRASGIGLNLKL